MAAIVIGENAKAPCLVGNAGRRATARGMARRARDCAAATVLACAVAAALLQLVVELVSFPRACRGHRHHGDGRSATQFAAAAPWLLVSSVARRNVPGTVRAYRAVVGEPKHPEGGPLTPWQPGADAAVSSFSSVWLWRPWSWPR
jgi:hypothetical protein